MLNLLSFFLGIICIFLIARYNKSNKLFWILLISMLGGFVGGTIAANMDSEKKVNITTLSTSICVQPTICNDLLMSNEEELLVEYKTVDTTFDNVDVKLTQFQSKSGFFKPRQYPDYIDTS